MPTQTSFPEVAKPPADRVSIGGLRFRPLRAILLGFASIAVFGGLWFLKEQLAPQITAPVSSESAYVASFAEKSIAVLPFTNLSHGENDALLVEAVQDDILTALGKIADLRVISRTSVSGYAAGEPRHLREIAQSLGAGYLLEGRVQRNGDKVQVAVVLTDARRAVRLWTMNFDREMGTAAPAQSEMVLRIAAQLHAEITPQEKIALTERPTQDLVAYEHYIRGKTLVESVANAQINERLVQAVQELDQAIAREPHFFLAWCQLAAAHDYIYFFGFDRSASRLALAQKAVETASRLRPDAGETHLAKANFLYRCHLDYEGARAELALTEHSLPNSSEAFELRGYVERRQGFWPESARSLQRALKLDPRNAFTLQQIGVSYQEFRRFGAMAAALDRALAIAPHDLDSRITRALIELEWKADPHPLQQTIDAILAENPESANDVADQWLYLSLCRRDPAMAARALAALPASGTSVDLNFPRTYCIALAARARGDEAAARGAFLAARAEVEKTMLAQPDYGPNYTVLGLIDAGLGHYAEAMREGRRGVELLPITKNSIDGGELMKYLGVIYAWCGEKDLAIKQIATTLGIPSSLSYGFLKLHPAWDILRGDPRFEKLVADLAPKN